MTQNHWMLAPITAVHGVRFALVLTSDGLPADVQAGDVGQDVADRMSAAFAGLDSLARAVAQQFGTPPSEALLRDRDPVPMPALRQIMLEFDGGYAFARSAADGSVLMVISTSEVDVKQLAQEMRALVLRVGQGLAVSARQGIGR